MKRTCHYAKSIGVAACEVADGRTVEVPIVPGILKHPMPHDLSGILTRPEAMRKYTIEALRHASWPILRRFPGDWLKECLDEAGLKPGRRQALLYLLD